MQRTLNDNGFYSKTQETSYFRIKRKFRLEFAKQHKEKGLDFCKECLVFR